MVRQTPAQAPDGVVAWPLIVAAVLLPPLVIRF
jgi:hypothetical protein